MRRYLSSLAVSALLCMGTWAVCDTWLRAKPFGIFCVAWIVGALARDLFLSMAQPERT